MKQDTIPLMRFQESKEKEDDNESDDSNFKFGDDTDNFLFVFF